jgi:hypothetical protein
MPMNKAHLASGKIITAIAFVITLFATYSIEDAALVLLGVVR